MNLLVAKFSAEPKTKSEQPELGLLAFGGGK